MRKGTFIWIVGMGFLIGNIFIDYNIQTKADAIKSLVPSFIGLGMCASVLIISKLESTQKEYNVREEKRC